MRWSASVAGSAAQQARTTPLTTLAPPHYHVPAELDSEEALRIELRTIAEVNRRGGGARVVQPLCFCTYEGVWSEDRAAPIWVGNMQGRYRGGPGS